MNLETEHVRGVTLGALQRMPRFREAAGALGERLGAAEACTFITALLERVSEHRDLGLIAQEILLMRLEKPLP